MCPPAEQIPYAKFIHRPPAQPENPPANSKGIISNSHRTPELKIRKCTNPSQPPHQKEKESVSAIMNE